MYLLEELISNLPEKYFKAFKLGIDYVPVYTNPDVDELMEISQADEYGNSIRFILDAKSKTIYTWRGDQVHATVLELLGMFDKVGYSGDTFDSSITIKNPFFLLGTAVIEPGASKMKITQENNYYAVADIGTFKKIPWTWANKYFINLPTYISAVLKFTKSSKEHASAY